MSQFPPCSGRPGTVRAPSEWILDARDPDAEPACAFVESGRRATTRSGRVALEDATRRDSRVVHWERRAEEGAQPIMPGCIRPAKRTCGMCREEQKMPSKSQMAA